MYCSKEIMLIVTEHYNNYYRSTKNQQESMQKPESHMHTRDYHAYN